MKHAATFAAGVATVLAVEAVVYRHYVRELGWHVLGFGRR